MSDSYAPLILAIDDTATMAELRLLKSVLESAGYRVLATRNPQRALEMARDNNVNLILAEHIVPVKGGPSLAQVLKRLKPEVPVALYSSAWSPPADAMKFADHFITKLVSIDELLSTIEELLATNQGRVAA
jgi:CheY-like chemotaxis protein